MHCASSGEIRKKKNEKKKKINSYYNFPNSKSMSIKMLEIEGSTY